MSNPIPILFVSDAPDSYTGLGRITRDLSTLLCRLPQYRVGTFGRGMTGSRHLPAMQYGFSEGLAHTTWGEVFLEKAWHDFAGDERGVIFTIWDASRLLWFGRPEFCGSQPLADFLTSGRFQRWGYFPIDSTGPNNKLTSMSADTLVGYDRLLAYTKFGAGVIEQTLGTGAQARKLDWLPHGINPDKFQPRDKEVCRTKLGIRRGETLIGVCMTNQARKDWGLTFAILAELKRRMALRAWLHVDILERHWSIPALMKDFELENELILSHHLNDAGLSEMYSACDLTMLPSLGEGFGYPLCESMACGVPAIHGNYAGGAELLPKEWLVEPCGYRLDTQHNVLRPVFRPEDWVEKIEQVLTQKPDAEWCVAQTAHLQWKSLWPNCWEKWFVQAAEEFR